MLTYQDYLADGRSAEFLQRLIAEHEAGELCRTARIADQYDRRRNVTINEFVRKVYTLSGLPVLDYTASNNRIASNFFERLNTQRAAYLLGAGATFGEPGTKAALGPDFDTRLYEAGRLALIHGLSFLYYGGGRVSVFPVTEFVPLWDEESGRLRAGLRFWRISPDKPVNAVLYEEEGVTRFRERGGQLVAKAPRRRWERVYASLPVVPLWGSRLHQSTLIGMRQAIDSFDLIRSGFANDLSDCAEIYWLLENYGGMSDDDLARFRDRIKFQHVAALETGGEGRLTPYAKDVPYQARMAYLDHMRNGIYEDFGALDVTRLSSISRTATELRAAYQPLDEQADDFEYQVITAVRSLLALLGIDDTPRFRRNRIANQKEEAEMVLNEAPYLDRRMVLSKLPNLTPEEAEEVMGRTEGVWGRPESHQVIGEPQS